jgi:hypothetical protein
MTKGSAAAVNDAKNRVFADIAVWAEAQSVRIPKNTAVIITAKSQPNIVGSARDRNVGDDCFVDAPDANW